MDEIFTQFAHIFIHYYSNKASSTCKLFVSEPTKSQELKLGRLFGILEINTPSRENSQILSQLINELEENFYSHMGDQADFEKSFEKTLKAVNQKFVQLIREKKFYMVGNLDEFSLKEKLNIVLGVVKGSEVCLSSLNNMGIYLVHKTKQDYKIIDLKKSNEPEKEEETAESAELLTNILTGEIVPGDFMFLANTNFLNYITLERVKKTITSIPVHKAAEYFKNSLLQNEGSNFAAIIIKNAKEEKTEDKKIASLTSISELNYTESSTEKLLSPNFFSILGGIKSKIFNAIKKEKIIEEQPEAAEKKPVSPVSKNYLQKAIFFLKYKVFKNKINNANIVQNIKSNESWAKLKQSLRLKMGYLGHYFKKIPISSKTLLFIAVILIIVFVYSTGYLKQKQKSEVVSQEYQNQVIQIEDKINLADSDLIFGDEQKTKEDIAKAQELIASLPIESQKQREKMQELAGRIENIISKLRHITVINDSQLIADLTDQNNPNITNLLYFAGKLEAFDANNNSAFDIAINPPEIKKADSTLTDIGKFVKAKIINGKILIYHDKNGFVEYQNSQFVPISAGLLPNQKIADFSGYNDRLYTVDVNANQIFKHQQNAGAYSSGIGWMNDTIDIKNTISMGIDTNIWLLQNTGKILKLTKGKNQNFEIKNLDPALESPTALFTDDQTKYIYVLESKNKRIVALDKNGTFVAQYFSDSWNNLQAFSVNESEKKIYFANDNKVYSFNLSN